MLSGALAINLAIQPMPRDLSSPSQQRVAFLGDTGVTVSWNTYQQLSNPTVKYGLSPSDLTETADSSSSTTYLTSTTWNNHVQITGLESGTTYYYQVENDSEVYSFSTAKAPGTNEEFSFAVVVDLGTMGDLGLSDHGPEDGLLAVGEQNTMQSLQDLLDEYEFVLHPGDIAYADYWLKEEYQGYLGNITLSTGYQVYEQILNAFYDGMRPVTANKPYMVGPGNHEADCDNGGYKSYTNSICPPGQTNFTGFKNHWNMPGDLSGGAGNMWYSFDYGLVHYVSYDTETDFPNGVLGPESVAPNGNVGSYENEQLDWLINDLKNVDRTKTPWVIAQGHRPWYVAGEACTTCQTAFESTLNDYGVDIVLAGHVHNYERIGPIGTGGVIDPNGLNNPSSPLYILNGIAGHYDGIDDLVTPLPDYVNFAQDTAYGWSKFTVHNCTHITHEFIASNNNTVLDRATLYKANSCPAENNTTSSSSIVSSSTSASSSSSASGSASLSSGYNSTSAAPQTSSVASELSSAVAETSTITAAHTTVVTITSCSDNKCSEVLFTSTFPTSADDYTETETNSHTTVITITSCEDNKCTEILSTSTLAGQSESTEVSSTSTLAGESEGTDTVTENVVSTSEAEVISSSETPVTPLSSSILSDSSSSAAATTHAVTTAVNSGSRLSARNVVVAAFALFAI
ncbi:hypothetical protein CLIB1423_08S00694 [[Candida] railenensis]|uniref:Purple acid phosphatase n=1 Tax=[Candida] railenensis TaxID=45579 RepID=A0A9P0QPZ7_9ASCO|nr:hypothetical protein CLIB1423_08S00694 [[Candida] railenensis]